jgi:anti-anti-sigma regulatory factor
VLRTPDTPADESPRPTCDVVELGTCVQLTAGGEFDIATIDVLYDAAAGIDLSPGRTVLLDLCEATLAGTAVVNFTLALQRRALARGASLVVIARPRTRELFELAGVEGITIVDDDGARDGPRRRG